MPAATRRLLRALSLPGFVLSVTGWALGLLAIQATASAPALVSATACGLSAVSCVAAWFALRPAARA